MATATNRSVNLQYQPVLGVRAVVVDLGITESIDETELAQQPQGITAITVGLELFNAGQVEVTYSMKTMRVLFFNRTSDDGRWLSRGGSILPGSSIVFRHPTIILDPPITTFPAKGKIDAIFEYYHDNLEIRKIRQARLEYMIAPGPGEFLVSWTFIDGSPAV